MSDWDTITNLAAKVVASNGNEWQEFTATLHAIIMEWLRSPGFVRWKHAAEDHRAEVAVRVLEKLERDDHACLRAFFARSGGRDDDRCAYFRNWLRLVVKRLMIDYLRGLPEYIRDSGSADHGRNQDRGRDDRPSVKRWRILQSYTTGKATYRPDNIPTIRANRCLDYLDRSIPGHYRRVLKRRSEGASTGRLARELRLTGRTATRRLLARAELRQKYRPALEMWSRDHSDSEIARELSLESGSQARRIIRAGLRVLRDHFRKLDKENR